MDMKRMWHTIRYMMFFKSNKRAEYIKKRHIFGSVGENCRLPLMILPLYSEHIFIGNNVEVASGVRLVVHDAIHGVFNNMPENFGRKYKEHIGKIEIGNNVFIGANSIILGPVKIRDNVVVGAGTLVNKDVPSGCVVGGVPAKAIGSFEGLMQKRFIEYDDGIEV